MDIKPRYSLTRHIFCEILVTTNTEQLIHAKFTNKQYVVILTHGISSQVNGYITII